MLSRRSIFILIFIIAAAALALLVAGCAAAPSGTANQAQASGTPVGLSVLGEAERQATAIIESARATAMLLSAQSEADAMLDNASAAVETVVETAQVEVAIPIITATPPVQPESQGDPYPTQVIAVSFAADGGMIFVQFYCDPSFGQYLFPGYIKVTNEATGMVYNEVPVLPVIGPLIARPIEGGQPGYAMLVNSPPGLKPGDVVTVELHDFKQEHVEVTQ